MSTPKVKVYTKDPCPYCVRAIQLLENLNIPFEEVDLTGQEQEIDRLKRETGWRTVPIILINDKVIGGYTDLKALQESGELEAALRS